MCPYILLPKDAYRAEFLVALAPGNVKLTAAQPGVGLQTGFVLFEGRAQIEGDNDCSRHSLRGAADQKRSKNNPTISPRNRKTLAVK